MKWIYIAILAFAPLARAGLPSQSVREDLKPEVHAYEIAAGLPALRPTMGFELRVWQRSYMSGSVYGTVVSMRSLRTFNTSSTYEHGKVIIKPASLSAPVAVSNFRKLKKLTSELEPYNGLSVSCDIADGGSVLVQAVVNGQILTLGADNPNLCSGNESEIVVRLLHEIHS